MKNYAEIKLRTSTFKTSQGFLKDHIKPQNGSILLFHARKKDAECLSVLIPQLVAEGYQLVTVSELLGLPEIVCSAEKYVYHRRDTEENIRPDAVPQN